ncbi:adenylyl-sulfate kinase [Paenibacillus chitinolyticus]|uniref:adenylyl-sulfate kinase n=1 Tax=Paenibacillus chitinolyticus TaxID=79263 RepID=UPI0026E4F21B|nr:adenylyl-sulfate kinase [Paenibacillus chitinolyticus]GKS11314.1 adenylyl-sulfate kinase [Paenibacillus chitinolyticus]
MTHTLNKTVPAGLAYWLTGLSGSGKTTTAKALAAEIAARGHAVECLDGDELRRQVGTGLGFSREDRMENVRRAVFISGLLNRNGITTVVSLISPYREMRAYARQNLPRFIEVFVDCPLEECERRDVKGLYAKARNGEIPAFTGISDPYEVPENPELIIRTNGDTLDLNVRKLLDFYD